jgi:hydroxymethylbilane synthase
MTLKLGTRGSDLARTQALGVARQLRQAGAAAELVVIRTAGDASDAPAFASIGPQGVFVREIEQALLAGDIDLAVHSAKDLPSLSAPELTIAAIPHRADPADLLLIAPGAFDEGAAEDIPLPAGARVGTSSARRRAWLAHLRPDLTVDALRGNVPTRLRRLREGRFDAILLAAAGIARLREAGDLLEPLLESVTVHRLDPRRFVPAPAQGSLAVQCRRGDRAVEPLLRRLDDEASRAAVTAEREALARAEGGCDVAFGAYCARETHGLVLRAMLERDGRILRAEATGEEPVALGAAVWGQLSGESA